LADTIVRVDAPERILAVLEATLKNVPRALAGAADVSIVVVPAGDRWEIRGRNGTELVLGSQSALPQISGAVISRVVHAVAVSREIAAIRATVVEKGGRALAMIGDDWESAITLATHLHGRGWSYVGADHVLHNPLTGEVLCVQKSLYINSSALSQLPMPYRRAVEASPWYVTPRGISFYSVDPTGAGPGPTWSSSATLAGVIVIDGAVGDTPALELPTASRLEEERVVRLGFDWSRISVVDLRLGGFVESCNLVEQWFDSIVPAC
jgi:hypothetical protein